MNAHTVLKQAVGLFKTDLGMSSYEDVSMRQEFEEFTEELEAALRRPKLLGEDDPFTIGSLEAGFRLLMKERAGETPDRTQRRKAYVAATKVLNDAGHNGVAPGRQFARVWAKIASDANDRERVATANHFSQDLVELNLSYKITRL